MRLFLYLREYTNQVSGILLVVGIMVTTEFILINLQKRKHQADLGKNYQFFVNDSN